MNNQLKDILILDIETVTAVSNYDEMSEGLQHHWDRKAGFLRNEEEKSPDDLFFDRGGIYAEFGKVIVIAIGIFHADENDQPALRVRSFENHDEVVLLKTFKSFIEEKFDTRNLRLCGHNGKEFDFPFLCRRMVVHGIEIPKVLDTSGKKPWEVNHLDTMEMWKFGDRKNYTSLDLLGTLFGIPSSKFDIDGSQVNKVYYNDENGLGRIAKYCQRDVAVTAQIFLKIKGLPIIDQEHVTFVDKSDD
jgi:hypothetical protein